jgi:16S rRNA (guanine(1405)-N(7))-methyltransferase
MSDQNSKQEKEALALEMAAKIQSSKKYQDLAIPQETLLDLIQQEMARYKKSSEVMKSVRAKLHNIMAPYLGDLDYEQAEQTLQTAFESPNPAAVQETCADFLRQHDSTRERLAYIEDFYQGIFSVCEHPQRVMDLACGLNPFALPWMGLPTSIQFYAYDIHPARIRLINRFLQLSEREPLAEVRDVLVRPPQIEADAAFLFKEAHRMEKRQRGCNRELWAALKVKYLFVSLPNRSLDGRRDLRERMRHLVESSMQGQDWKLGELDFPGETVYWMRKGGM